MQAKETLGDGYCKTYANSQPANQNRQEQSAGCRLCRIAQEAQGERTDCLAVESCGHINSAGCERMATTVTAAHQSIWRHLYDSMHAAKMPKSKLKFFTPDKESNMTCGDDKIFLESAAKKIWRRRHRQ